MAKLTFIIIQKNIFETEFETDVIPTLANPSQIPKQSYKLFKFRHFFWRWNFEMDNSVGKFISNVKCMSQTFFQNQWMILWDREMRCKIRLRFQACWDEIFCSWIHLRDVLQLLDFFWRKNIRDRTSVAKSMSNVF